MAASRGEAFVRRRATYQDVLEAPVHQIRQDCRWDAVHPSAARTATYTGKLGARRKDRPSLRFRHWGPGRVVDPRRTGAAPRRRRPRAEPCGATPGTDRGPAPYAVLSPCAGLGVRGAVALDAKVRSARRASGLRAKASAPVARRSDGPHLGGVRAPVRRVDAHRVRERRRPGEHPAVRCDHVAQLALDWKIGPRLVCFAAAEDFAQCSRTCL